MLSKIMVLSGCTVLYSCTLLYSCTVLFKPLCDKMPIHDAYMYNFLRTGSHGRQLLCEYWCPAKFVTCEISASLGRGVCMHRPADCVEQAEGRCLAMR